MAPLVWDLRTDIRNFAIEKHIDLTRPLIALGYSGGFPVLTETVAQMGLNLKGLVGVGAALISLDELLDVMKPLGTLLEKIVHGGVAGVNLLGDLVQLLFSKVPWVSRGVNFVIDDIVGNVLEGTTEGVLQAIRTVQEVFKEGIEAIKIQNLIRLQSWIGQRKLAGIPMDAVVNIYGQDDQIVRWGIGGEVSAVAGIPINEVLNIEIRSSDSAIKADHFIYMHGIRDNGSVEQNNFDSAAADFVADLLVKMQGKTQLQIQDYIKRTYPGKFTEEGNKIVFYPQGVPSVVP